MLLHGKMRVSFSAKSKALLTYHYFSIMSTSFERNIASEFLQDEDFICNLLGAQSTDSLEAEEEESDEPGFHFEPRFHFDCASLELAQKQIAIDDDDDDNADEDKQPGLDAAEKSQMEYEDTTPQQPTYQESCVLLVHKDGQFSR